MDNSLSQQEADSQKLGGFLASLQIILRWLSDLFQLTEEEHKAAGIYLDDQKY